jgi:hypothetical protein
MSSATDEIKANSEENSNIDPKRKLNICRSQLR